MGAEDEWEFNIVQAVDRSSNHTQIVQMAFFLIEIDFCECRHQFSNIHLHCLNDTLD